MNSQQDQVPEVVSPFPSQTPIVAAALSLALFALFIFTSLGAFTLFASAAAGLVAIIFGSLALKRGESRALNISSICVGGFFLLLSIAIVIFALIFVGAISV